MNSVLQKIVSIIDAARDKPDYLDTLFGHNKDTALAGRPIVIFGAGGLGKEIFSTLKQSGLQAIAFCDNDASRIGSSIEGTPVISLDTLLHDHHASLIIIAVLKHRTALAQQLMAAGIPTANLLCTDERADFVYMYSMVGTQVLFSDYEEQSRPGSYLDCLILNQDRIAMAHKLLHDEHSKSLLLAKLALMASQRNFAVFCEFIQSFSAPYRDFGLTGYDGTPEDYYYFNNDVIKLANNEIYVDIGAYDGDTLITFEAACRNQNVTYQRVIAFEPDSACYEKLLLTASSYRDVICHQLGLWSESTRLRFKSSANVIHDQAAAISEAGDLEIKVVSLDDFLEGKQVTLVKADPGGNIIPQVLYGAVKTLRKHRPKLVVGAYHGHDSIFALPLLVHEINPEYQLSLRHNTFHLCDTALYATCT